MADEVCRLGALPYRGSSVEQVLIWQDIPQIVETGHAYCDHPNNNDESDTLDLRWDFNEIVDDSTITSLVVRVNVSSDGGSCEDQEAYLHVNGVSISADKATNQVLKNKTHEITYTFDGADLPDVSEVIDPEFGFRFKAIRTKSGPSRATRVYSVHIDICWIPGEGNTRPPVDIKHPMGGQGYLSSFEEGYQYNNNDDVDRLTDSEGFIRARIQSASSSQETGGRKIYRDSHGAIDRHEPGCPPKVIDIIEDIRCVKGGKKRNAEGECPPVGEIQHIDYDSHGALHKLEPGDKGEILQAVTAVRCSDGELTIQITKFAVPPGTKVRFRYVESWGCCGEDKPLVLHRAIVEFPPGTVADGKDDKEYDLECCDSIEKPVPKTQKGQAPDGFYLTAMPWDDCNHHSYPLAEVVDSHGRVAKLEQPAYTPTIIWPVIDAQCTSYPCTPPIPGYYDWSIHIRHRKVTLPAISIICKETKKLENCCKCCPDYPPPYPGASETSTSTSSDTSSSDYSSSSSSSLDSFYCCDDDGLPPDLQIKIEFIGDDGTTVCCTRVGTIVKNGINSYTGTIPGDCGMDIDFFCMGSLSWELSLDQGGGPCVLEITDYECEPCFDASLEGVDCSVFGFEGCGESGGMGDPCQLGSSGQLNIYIIETAATGDPSCPPIQADPNNCGGLPGP